jgi:hypothetical protein
MSTGYIVYLPAKFDILRLGCTPNDLNQFNTNIDAVLYSITRLKADGLIDKYVLDEMGSFRFLVEKLREAGLIICELNVDGTEFIKALSIDEKNKFRTALEGEGLSDKTATLDKVENLLSDIVGRLRQGAQEIADDLGVELKDL